MAVSSNKRQRALHSIIMNMNPFLFFTKTIKIFKSFREQTLLRWARVNRDRGKGGGNFLLAENICHFPHSWYLLKHNQIDKWSPDRYQTNIPRVFQSGLPRQSTRFCYTIVPRDSSGPRHLARLKCPSDENFIVPLKSVNITTYTKTARFVTDEMQPLPTSPIYIPKPSSTHAYYSMKTSSTFGPGRHHRCVWNAPASLLGGRTRYIYTGGTQSPKVSPKVGRPPGRNIYLAGIADWASASQTRAASVYPPLILNLLVLYMKF